MSASSAGLRIEEISTAEGFARLAEPWDELVRSMPRPSPFLLHAWLDEWWRHNRDGVQPVVHAAFDDGRLVGGLPLCLIERRGLQVLSFQGGSQSALADIVLDRAAPASIAKALADRAESSGQDLALLYGLPASSRLVEAVGPDRLHLVERSEAPVVELDGGWEDVYRAKTTAKRRNQHARKRKQLAATGRLETQVAREPRELEAALEEAFELHEIRWHGRPDGSGFATPAGRQFHRAALRRLAELGIPRIVVLRLDGRSIAFHYYFLFERRMYVHRLAFDPAYARHSPGLLNTLDAIEAAAAEGATMVEFLGGAERYTLELADRLEPLYEAIGLAPTLRGRLAVAGVVNAIRLRKWAKRSHGLRRFYYEGLAPARIAAARVLRRGRSKR
jgi:CelD/BcsL family acetyltransferase involved in cellulose biosynthesis